MSPRKSGFLRIRFPNRITVRSPWRRFPGTPTAPRKLPYTFAVLVIFAGEAVTAVPFWPPGVMSRSRMQAASEEEPPKRGERAKVVRYEVQGTTTTQK